MDKINDIYDIVEKCDLCGQSEYVIEKRFLANEWKPVKKFYHDNKQITPFQWLPDEFELLKCSNCGLMFVNPRIKGWVVNRFYDEYLSGRYEGYIHNYDSVFREKLFKEYFKSILKFVKKGYTKKCFLDVGCASGNFMKIFSEHGFKSYGIEIAPSIAEKAKKHGEVYIGDVESELMKFHSNSFDVVTLVDSIEHFISPRRTMELVYDKLKPDGVVFIETPNCLAGLDIMSRHFYLFSVETLGNLLQKIGFSIQFNSNSNCVYNPTDKLKEGRFIHLIAIK